ncbi:ribonuclease H [Senna tora]|uniref:Ribonuclease H n=1 Tax=Senna tora TaxID=362788 RepID=A0A834WZ80_9FABA|nr:ribonuclease H [Senna tora]
MNVPCNMVDVIMRCVTSVSYSILVNGTPSESFLPQRGIRQGDPLSPYLFIICAEVFSCLLDRAVNDGWFQGVKIGRSSPSISCLFFADDSIIFSRSTEEATDGIFSVIQAYECASGQRVNLEKTELSFMIQERMRVKEIVCSMFLPVEATEILSIPLSWSNVEDKLIWPLEKHNNFSVRSACHFIHGNCMRLLPSASNCGISWSKIWCLSVPPKVRNFFWRLCDNALPTRLFGYIPHWVFILLSILLMSSMIGYLIDLPKKIWKFLDGLLWNSIGQLMLSATPRISVPPDPTLAEA